MKKFSDYVEVRNRFELASQLVENEVDIDVWVKHVVDVTNSVDLNEAELYNELVAGLTHAIGQNLGAGAGMVGRGLAAGAGAVGRGLAAGAGVVGRGLAAGAGVANRAGQHFANQYQQGEQAAKLNKAMQGIDQLQKHLSSLADPQVVAQYLDGLRTKLQQMSAYNKDNLGARFGNNLTMQGGVPARPMRQQFLPGMG